MGVDARLAPLPQRGEGALRLTGDPQRAELGKVNFAEPDVGPRVEPGADRQRAGVGEQPLGVGAPRRQSGLLGGGQHLLARLQVTLGVAAIDVAQVERDQTSGRVQHVHRGRASLIGHPDVVGEHPYQPVAVGEAEHPPGMGGRADASSGQPVIRDTDRQLLRRQHLPPAGERPLGGVGAARGEGVAEVGIGTQQHDEVVGVPRHQFGGQHRFAALPRQVDRRGQPAQRGPARPGGGVHHHPRQPRIAQFTTPHRFGCRAGLASGRERGSSPLTITPRSPPGPIAAPW